MSFYKTTAPSVIDAWKQYLSDKAALFAEAKAFANDFDGARPAIKNSGCNIYFAGLHFGKAIADTRIWTKDRDCQVPRSGIAAGLKGEEATECRAALKALREKWQKAPTNQVNNDKMLGSMGLDWSAGFLGGYTIFLGVDGAIYLKTGVNTNDLMTEILGSEYHLAWEAANKAKEANK